MRRFLLLAVALGSTLASGASAQEPGLPEGVPGGLAERVREEVASRWDAPVHDVALDFTSIRDGVRLAEDAAFELVGSGAGGHWVLRADAEDGSRQSLRMRAGTWVSTRVAGRTLERDEVLLLSDMTEVREILWGAPREVETPPAEGWVVQRLIREGERLARPAVQPPLAVRSGEAVQVLWSNGGVGVRAPGRAAGSATVGQQVYVRTATGARLKGVVVAPGLVNVTQGGTER